MSDIKGKVHKIIFILALIIVSSELYCQNDSIKIIKEVEDEFYDRTLWDSTYIDSIYSWQTKSWGIITGLNFNSKLSGELGFGKARYGVTWHHWFLSNYYIGSEFTIYDNKLILAPKASLWMNGGSAGMALGISLINYTDFKESSLKIRPEIGVGFSKFKVVYGYNISTFNKDFAGIGNHNVNIVLYFDLKKTDNYELTYRDILERRKSIKLDELNKNAP